MRIERILVPIDFSPESLQAVEAARGLAAQCGARVRFMTALEVGDLRAALAAHLSGFQTDEEVHEALERWIDDNYRRIGAEAEDHRIRRGIAEREILDEIGEYDPQIVVMGSAGLARRLPLGSTTDYVLRHSRVPVLVVMRGE